jgi:general secretion pathway protein I
VKTTRGFTLLEVLIALAVVGVAVLALSRSGGQAPRHYHDLRQTTEALWVGENVLAALRIETDFPPTGVRSGRERMGRVDWRWQATVSATPDPDIRRADVVVFAERLDAPAATHTGFFGRR